MKSLMKGCVLSVAMLVLMCGVAGADESFNAQGSVLVPAMTHHYINSNSYHSTDLKLSNITDKTIQCKVTVFDHDGNDATSYGSVHTGSLSNGGGVTLSSGSGLFDIPSHSSRMFFFSASKIPMQINGYAVVEWKSEDKNQRRALIGTVQLTGGGGSGLYSNRGDLNNGQPF